MTQNNPNLFPSYNPSPRIPVFAPEDSYMRPYPPSFPQQQNIFTPTARSPSVSWNLAQQADLQKRRIIEDRPLVGILRKDASMPSRRTNTVIEGFPTMNPEPYNPFVSPRQLLHRAPSLQQFDQLPTGPYNQPMMQPLLPRLSLAQLPPMQTATFVPGGFLTPQHMTTKSLSIPNKFESSLEMFVEKQNQLLSKMLSSMNSVGQQERYQKNIAMKQKIQEMEINKIQTELELEKQKSRKLELEMKSQKESSLKNEKPKLNEALYDMILSQKEGMKKSTLINPRLTRRFASDQTLPDSEYYAMGTPVKKNTLVPLSSVKSQQEIEDVSPNGSMSARNQGGKTKSLIVRKDVANGESVKINLPSLNDQSSMMMTRSNVFVSPNESSMNLGARTELEFESPKNTSRRRMTGSTTSIDKQYEDSSSGEQIETKSPRKKKTIRLRKSRTKSKVNVEKDNSSIDELAEIILQKEKKKNEAKHKLAAFGWTMVLGRILFNEAKTFVLTRKETFGRVVSEDIAQAYDLIKDYVMQSCGKEILNMINDTKQTFVFAGVPTSQSKKSEKLSVALMDHFKVIFNKLIVQTSTLSLGLSTILSNLTKENSCLANDYFSEFELRRLRFTTYGNLKEMTQSRIKLMFGSVIIIRVLIYFIIMHPWDMFKQDKSKFKMEKLLNIGSILYNTTMDIFKASVPVSQNNQSFLSVDLKIHPKKNPFRAIEDPTEESKFKIEKDTTKDGDIVQGFYAKQQLSSFFVDNKKVAMELRALIEGWLDAIFNKVYTGVRVAKSIREL